MKKTLCIILLLFTISQINLFAQANSSGDLYSKWSFRLRGIVVMPDEGADIESIGGDVDISTSFVPEFDITYYFTKNWAAELILGTTKHDVKAVHTAAGEIDLGEVWLLPPTLSLQYHFNTTAFKPYLGAGINYTIFYSVDEGPVVDDMDYDNSLGFSCQAGLDYMISDKWFINIDIKKLFLQTDATVNATTALGAIVGADVDINPWILGIGLGIRL